MRSIGSDVGDYLQVVPYQRRDALHRLRRQCRETLTSHDEAMARGMPAYVRDGTIEVAFASHYRYISLYILQPTVLERYRAVLQEAGFNVRETCINFPSPDKIPFDIVQSLLDDIAAGTLHK